jgi:hypothetical protein
MRKWGEKKDHLYYLTEFGSLEKKASENVVEFNKRFTKLYNIILHDIKPSQATRKFAYARAFETDFGYDLERKEIYNPPNNER